MIQGESYSIGILFNSDYDKSRIEDMELCVGNVVVAKNNDIVLKEGIYRCQLSSSQTRELCPGKRHITLHLQDKILGVVKPVVATIVILPSYSKKTSQALNTGLNLLVEVKVEETVSVENITLANVIKGEKGDALTFSDLTPEQKAELKGRDGKSAYNIAVEEGFVGTKKEWLNNLSKRSLPTLNVLVDSDSGSGFLKKTFNLMLSDALSDEMMKLNPVIVLLRKKRTGRHFQDENGRSRHNKIKWVEPGLISTGGETDYVGKGRGEDGNRDLFVFPITTQDAGKNLYLTNDTFSRFSAQDIAEQFTKIINGSRKGFEPVRTGKNNMRFYNDDPAPKTAYFDLMSFCVRIDNPDFTGLAGYRTDRTAFDGVLPYLYGPKTIFRVGLVKLGRVTKFSDFDIAVSLKE